jgi:aromatic ring-opening dioxygenase LigB subunit
MSLVFACIAPHGDVDLDPALRPAMEELGRRAAAAQPDVAIVVTPHSVHVQGHFAVVTSGKVGAYDTEMSTAQALLEADLPILSVSYGSNYAELAEFPIDWGAEIPLEFVKAPKVVVVSPARDRSFAEHLRLGEAIAALPGRVALIASADHGHAHTEDGIYGYHPDAARYDALLQEILASDRMDFHPLAEFVENGTADSLWQLLVLQGAVGEAARSDVLAYAAPTYYGMLVAEVHTAA